jgi:hypothetical protein
MTIAMNIDVATKTIQWKHRGGIMYSMNDAYSYLQDCFDEEPIEAFPVPRRREAIEHTRRKLGL